MRALTLDVGGIHATALSLIRARGVVSGCARFVNIQWDRTMNFTVPVTHDASRGVDVLNLVEGREALVESPNNRFDPLTVHYAETFIVPAAAGEYRVRPTAPATKPLATIKAFVRTMA